jgi:hypothetical protein
VAGSLTRKCYSPDTRLASKKKDANLAHWAGINAIVSNKDCDCSHPTFAAKKAAKMGHQPPIDRVHKLSYCYRAN